MALISKKTFRKWARILTDRGLTLENAELFAELGDTVTVKRKRTQSGIFTIDQTGTVSWSLGAVWFNGGILPVTGTTTGDTISLSFTASDHREQRVYCKLSFTHHAELNRNTIFAVPPVPEEDVDFYTTTRAVNSGSPSFEVGFAADETTAFLSTPAYINTATNTGTTGVKRMHVATLRWVEADPPLIPYGFWTAEETTVADPSKLIIFNLNDYSDGRSWPTLAEMALV